MSVLPISAAAALPRWKRTLDLAGVLVALPLLGVCVLLVWILVLLFSRGPIFFEQERIGLDGRAFRLLKFRTMHLGVETESHRAHVAALFRSGTPMQKLDGRRDPRLFPGGWLLRASGLDELPQILNVLRSEMSLVGPRPCLPYELEHFDAAQRRRFAAMPGLTGLWQVSGKNRTTFEKMIQLDLAYRERLSLRGDLWILARTAPVLLGQVLEALRVRRRARIAVLGVDSREAPASRAVAVPRPIPSTPHRPPSIPVP